MRHLLLADPEPKIRMQALQFMLHSGGDLAVEALERSRKEPATERRRLRP